MGLDMNTHGREIRQAIESVTSDSGDDWCIIGYEGKETLFVAGHGDGGLEEMVDEFHGSKIMYGYVRVKEPNTGLPKFVFINWQGEGAPERMKFACGSHSTEVQRLCRPVHVTVNARDESDLDPPEIMSRVIKASGSQFSVLKSSGDNASDQRPVIAEKPKGSVYKKVNPTAEILNRERDAYWQKLEREEAQQKAADLKRKRAEKEKEERDRKAREERETQERERRAAERARQISAQRSQEQKAVTAGSSQPSRFDDDAEAGERERRQRSESLKNQRQEELAALVAQRNAAGLAPSQKISSTYQKVDPRAELAALQRDQYWSKMEQEEKQRKEEEMKQVSRETAEREQARIRREEEDAKRREMQARDRAQAIAQQRQAEKQRAEDDRKKMEAMARAQHREATEDEEERNSRSERLRRERQEEAARLIGQRSSNAKTAFQGGDSAPVYEPQPPTQMHPPQPPAQMHPPQPPPQLPQSPSPPLPQEPQPQSPPASKQPATSPSSRPLPCLPPEDEPVWAPTSPVASPSDGWTVAQASSLEPREEDNIQQTANEEEQPEGIDEEVPLEPQGYDQGVTAEAIYDYAAAEEDEVSFVPGDIITNIEQVDDGWWTGQTSDGHWGLFPSNYVRLI